MEMRELTDILIFLGNFANIENACEIWDFNTLAHAKQNIFI